MTEAASEISLVRFYGRNRDTWEKQGIGPAKRFSYLYPEEELREWTPKIKRLADKTKQCHVLINNSYEDKAVADARQMRLVADQRRNAVTSAAP